MEVKGFMAKKGAIKLAGYVVLVVLLSFVAINGLTIGFTKIKPVQDAIKRGLDLTGGVYTVYQAKDTTAEDFEYEMQSAMTVLRTRLDGKGFTEATVTRQGSDKIRIEIPINKTSEEQDVNAITKYIATPAVIEFVDPNGEVIMTGKNIVSAKAASDTKEGYVVNFQLDAEGTKAFSNATTEFIGQQISITMDGEVISSPKVNQAITGGKGDISGGFTLQEAQELGMQIESGSLPLELEEIEVRSINATLGADALQTSVLAGAIGIALIMLFMIGYYRLPGITACLALTSYILLLMLFIALFEIQLTLPGIAGVILSIGMAVDANVIIFERFKEEARLGKSLSASMESGFKRAFSSIIDANTTTLIAATVLFIFGTGSVKGFAYTLFIGICLSMFSAVVLTKFLMRTFIQLNIKNKSLFVARLEK